MCVEVKADTASDVELSIRVGGGVPTLCLSACELSTRDKSKPQVKQPAVTKSQLLVLESLIV